MLLKGFTSSNILSIFFFSLFAIRLATTNVSVLKQWLQLLRPQCFEVEYFEKEMASNSKRACSSSGSAKLNISKTANHSHGVEERTSLHFFWQLSFCGKFPAAVSFQSLLFKIVLTEKESLMYVDVCVCVCVRLCIDSNITFACYTLYRSIDIWQSWTACWIIIPLYLILACMQKYHSHRQRVSVFLSIYI